MDRPPSFDRESTWRSFCVAAPKMLPIVPTPHPSPAPPTDTSNFVMIIYTGLSIPPDPAPLEATAAARTLHAMGAYAPPPRDDALLAMHDHFKPDPMQPIHQPHHSLPANLQPHHLSNANPLPFVPVSQQQKPLRVRPQSQQQQQQQQQHHSQQPRRSLPTQPHFTLPPQQQQQQHQQHHRHPQQQQQHMLPSQQSNHHAQNSHPLHHTQPIPLALSHQQHHPQQQQQQQHHVPRDHPAYRAEPSPVTPTTPATPTTHPFPTPSSPDNQNSSSASAAREHTCTYPGCGKTFDRRYNLTVHYRRHTNEMPYPCKHPGCPQKFKWRSSQSHHMKTRHQFDAKIVKKTPTRSATERSVPPVRTLRYAKKNDSDDEAQLSTINVAADKPHRNSFSPKKRARLHQ